MTRIKKNTNLLINKITNQQVEESKLIERIMIKQSLPIDVVKNFRKSRGTFSNLKINY